MKKIILVIGMLVFNQLCFSELTQNTTHHFKLIKLTEDAITDDSYKPIAGKEKLLAAKVTDEEGKGVFGAEVKFSIQDTDCGFIVISTKEVQRNEITIRTNIIGEAVVFLRTSANKNTLLIPEAIIVNQPEQKIKWNIQTTELSERIVPINRDWHKAIRNNEEKLKTYKATLEIESDMPGQPKHRTINIEKQANKKHKKLRIKEKGKKDYETVSEDFWYPPLYDTEPIAYNQKTKTVIFRNISKDSNMYPYRLLYVDFPRGIIIKEERYRYYMNGLVHKFETEYNNWNEDKKIAGGYRYKNKIERIHSGLKKEKYRTTTKITDVE